MERSKLWLLILLKIPLTSEETSREIGVGKLQKKQRAVESHRWDYTLPKGGLKEKVELMQTGQRLQFTEITGALHLKKKEEKKKTTP